MSLQQYNVDLSDIAEWIPWGGLTLPHVLENKDGSMFSVIRYRAIEKDAPPIDMPKLPRGWVIWVERQRHDRQDHDYLVICWNPFRTGSVIRNTLSKPIRGSKYLDYFGQETKRICETVGKATDAALLEYQDIIDYLSFTLAIGLRKWEMPEIPLYLDVYLSQDLGLAFDANEIRMKDRRYLVCSVLGNPDLDGVHRSFSTISYRHVRRLLCMDPAQGKKEVAKYSSRWCLGRKYVKKEIFGDLTEGSLCGYFSEYFIFLLDDANYDAFRAFANRIFQQKGIPYRFEEYFFKDIWWGSLPGIYQADINPPAQFYRDFGEILQHKPEKKKNEIVDNGPKTKIIRIKKGGGL